MVRVNVQGKTLMNEHRQGKAGNEQSMLRSGQPGDDDVMRGEGMGVAWVGEDDVDHEAAIEAMHEGCCGWRLMSVWGGNIQPETVTGP